MKGNVATSTLSNKGNAQGLPGNKLVAFVHIKRS